jgi:hypothetical protein
MIFIFSVSLYAQHTVNDIQQYGGWFKVRVEIENAGNITYFVTQCYPSGEEYNVVGAEKERLPFPLHSFSISHIQNQKYWMLLGLK